MTIILKDLSHARLSDWLAAAENKKESDPIFAFISTWISFNYYYATFALANNNAFERWANANRSGNKGDRSQWLFLINCSDFLTFFGVFKSKYADLFTMSVKLPIQNMFYRDKKIPDGVSGITQLRSLTTAQIFEVIYQIRNNLFHGSKNPFKDRRDRKLTTFSVNFLFPLMLELLDTTIGYELDAIEMSKSQQRVFELIRSTKTRGDRDNDAWF